MDISRCECQHMAQAQAQAQAGAAELAYRNSATQNGGL
jgi:hypothetical protein